MKYISLLGSTGSIGTQTLDVIRRYGDCFRVSSLSTNKSIDLLESQIKEFSPSSACVADEESYKILKRRYVGKTRLLCGKEGLNEIAASSKAEVVLTALVGACGIEPTVHAIQAGKDIALANKETLVAAGPLITELCKKNNVRLLPVDSEHSAIFQCLEGQRRENVDHLIITASGGPLRSWATEDIAKATAADCLKHPTWNMGSKITIDSATLFNKGLEVIEAHWLFGFDFDHIKVVVHPQSIVHSMIVMKDGAVLAQMGTPDMREPIQYALTYPKRRPLFAKGLNLEEVGKLEFFTPRYDDFPALSLAFKVGRIGGYAPAVFNAVNEEAVYAFLDNKIKFPKIFDAVQTVLSEMTGEEGFTLEGLLQMDAWAREKARALLKSKE